MLTRLIYVSSATHDMTTAELKDLLDQCHRNNERLKITGMLLYAGGNLLQVLEGEAEAVRSLYQVIEKDPRHHSAIIIDEQEIAERSFPTWTMGFKHLTVEDKANLVGYTEFLERKMAPNEFLSHADGVEALLYQFAEMNRR